MRCAVLTVASVAFVAGLFTVSASAFDAAALDRAKLATIGVLEDTQDQRTPDKPGKILVRGTGFHLRDGYIVTARHAAEKQDVTTGTVIQKQIHVLTTDHLLSATRYLPSGLTVSPSAAEMWPML